MFPMSVEPAAGHSAEWSAQIVEVYTQQGRELWARFYAQCSDPERAYDALQEAFTRLHQQNGTVIRDMRAWLLRVGQNWLRDVARRKVNQTKNTEHLDRFSDSKNDPAALVAREELHGVVREALEELKEDDREVLVFRYALNWSSQRIADTIDISPAAVDMRLSRARKRLAAILERDGIDHEYL